MELKVYHLYFKSLTERFRRFPSRRILPRW